MQYATNLTKSRHTHVHCCILSHDSTSIRPPLACATASIHLVTVRHERRSVSPLVSNRAVSRPCFRTAVLLGEVAHAQASRMKQIAKSIGLRSELEGGNMFLPQSLWKVFWQHCWVNFEMCDGAPS